MSSVLLIVNVLGKKDDVLRLKVAGRHYDSPVSKILGVSQKRMEEFEARGFTDKPNRFLRPNHNRCDPRSQRIPNGSVRALPVKDAGRGLKEYATDTVSRVVHSFGIPVEEELHSVGETIRRISGHDEMQ